MEILEIEGLSVHVIRKPIKTLNVSVKAPDGHVRVSVPFGTTIKQIELFVLKNLDWIRERQQYMKEKGDICHFETGDTIFVFGERKALTVTETDSRCDWGVILTDDGLHMTAPKDSTEEDRKNLLYEWQRVQLKPVCEKLIVHWCEIMQVTVKEWHIKRMRTRWGSCNYVAHRIWMSLFLAEQPLECVEYVAVHEICHLLEPSHNDRFWKLMTEFLPDWHERRELLNSKAKSADEKRK